ncbi:hypothetical protein B0F90DRAFT_1622907 [Multifurca ochricompacta]|uniref:Fe2OG dioxygenase domain-containing protein n=1 Tax=Multifurca ochricompacta TaxID=376703 RepID=A0AAD4MBG7_9AGAM|nr:hypothetical protein B0F90DRAFT_1622907 [Multifurca ochricompacta]
MTSPSHSYNHLFDPTSRGHKHAKRHYYKTTKNRAEDFNTDWTPFRVAEKKYKAHFPPPDLSDVLDLALLDPSRSAEIERGGWKGRTDTVNIKEISLQNVPTTKKSRAFTVANIHGLVILPSFVSDESQRNLIRWSLLNHARHPNETNLDTHYILPSSGLWSTYLHSPETTIQPRASLPSTISTSSDSSSPRHLISNTPASPATFSLLRGAPRPPPMPSVHAQPLSAKQLLPRLRWANIGWSYHWGTKQYDFASEVQPIGEPFRNVCTEVVRSICWYDVFGRAGAGPLDDWGEGNANWQAWNETYEPDAGIVNFYQTKDTLMGHVDHSELCATSPLVSISLGNAAIFLIGGLTRDVTPIPILLRSGDVVVMSGPTCRRAYHGVPRILEETLPLYLEEDVDADRGMWAPYARYMRTTRINVNMRQVFPKGFDPCLVHT